MARDTTGNRSIETTTDHETIRRWIEERGSTAARVTESAGDDPGSLAVVPEDTDDDSIEKITWEEFFEVFEEEDLAFVYQTERDDPNERWFCRFVDREREVSEDPFETERPESTWIAGERYTEEQRIEEANETIDAVDEIEDRTGGSTIEEGEVAETEVTRTEIVEKEIVVTDRIRSRVVGSEIVERNTVDDSVIDREIDRCEIVEERAIETEVIETRRVTEEIFEVYTVESEVISSETVERELTEGDSDVDTVGEPMTEGPAIDLVEDDLERGTIVENEVVRRDLEKGTLAEGDVIETEVVERRVIEREIADRILVRSEIEDTERIDSRIVESEVLESEIVERDSGERERAASTGGEGFEPRIEGVREAEAETAELETGTVERGPVEPTVEVTEDEVGKTVINTYGDEIGVVSEVRGGTLYVDPDAGLTEKVASRFGWGGGEESYPVEARRIESITADEVEISRL